MLYRGLFAILLVVLFAGGSFWTVSLLGFGISGLGTNVHTRACVRLSLAHGLADWINGDWWFCRFDNANKEFFYGGN